MLSILIPTYNFNAYPLAQVIEKMALRKGIIYELICMDDGSFSKLNIENQKINTLTNCKFIESRQNKGRTANRKALAELAQYDWLLFLDADVQPKDEDFLSQYLDNLNSKHDAIFGGFLYSKKHPGLNRSLRYKFGINREQVDAVTRNKNPYKVIISANYVITKKIFLQINQTSNGNLYGMDYMLSAELKKYNIKVKHINNEVYHLGIDTNDDYLLKAKKSVETLKLLSDSNKISSHSISLLKAHRILKLFFLNKFFGKLTHRFNSKIERNLKSEDPSLTLFDIYRLGYYCQLKNH